MATDALRTRAVTRMVMMIRGIVVTGVVALGADTVALHLQVAAMGVVAIRADNSSQEHLALLKGAQHKHLFPDAPIGIVNRSGQGLHASRSSYCICLNSLESAPIMPFSPDQNLCPPEAKVSGSNPDGRAIIIKGLRENAGLFYLYVTK